MTTKLENSLFFCVLPAEQGTHWLPTWCRLSAWTVNTLIHRFGCFSAETKCRLRLLPSTVGADFWTLGWAVKQ